LSETPAAGLKVHKRERETDSFPFITFVFAERQWFTPSFTSCLQKHPFLVTEDHSNQLHFVMTATSIPSMDLPETMSSSLPLKKRPVRTTDFANVEELATPKRMRIDGHHNIIMNNHHLSTRYPYSVASFGSASPRHESSAPLPAHVNSASGSGYTRDILFRHLQPLIHATAFDYSQLALSKSHSSAVSSLIGRGAGSHSSYLDALHYINSQRSMYPMTRPPMSSSTSSSTSTAPSPYSFLPPSPPESRKYNFW
jgi:hypothetical protein